MAQNVLLKYGDTSVISGETVQQGKILIDTQKAEISIDKDGTTRLPLTPTVDSALSRTSTNAISNKAITTSIVNTTAEVNAITADNIPCGTKPVKELITNLNAPTVGAFIYDYQNGKAGYNTSPLRGADTFHPFRGKITIPNIVAEYNSVSAAYLMTEINVEDCTLLKIGAISFAGSVLNPTVQVWAYSTALGSYTTAQSNLSFDVSGYPTVRIVVTGVSDQRSLTRKAQVTNITIE